MDAGLHIVGTPIGNLADVSARALDTLRAATAVVAEDTRVTRRLLQRHGISAPLISCHKFSEAARADEIARRAAREPIALVSDSGMPGLSDPGARIVRACRAAGVRIVVVPGPSAVTAALALSGFTADRFTFGGFLPSHGQARRRSLEVLLGRDETIVLFESPHRIRKLAEELAGLAPTRPVCLAREMTKLFEESFVALGADLPARLAAHPPRGEYTVVIAPSSGEPQPEVDRAEGGPD